MRIRKATRFGFVICLLGLLVAGGLQLWGDSVEFVETCIEDSSQRNGCKSVSCTGSCAQPAAIETGFVDNCWCL